jgi:hypothetical protein
VDSGLEGNAGPHTVELSWAASRPSARSQRSPGTPGVTS